VGTSSWCVHNKKLWWFTLPWPWVLRSIYVQLIFCWRILFSLLQFLFSFFRSFFCIILVWIIFLDHWWTILFYPSSLVIWLIIISNTGLFVSIFYFFEFIFQPKHFISYFYFWSIRLLTLFIISILNFLLFKKFFVWFWILFINFS